MLAAGTPERVPEKVADRQARVRGIVPERGIPLLVGVGERGRFVLRAQPLAQFRPKDFLDWQGQALEPAEAQQPLRGVLFAVPARGSEPADRRNHRMGSRRVRWREVLAVLLPGQASARELARVAEQRRVASPRM